MRSKTPNLDSHPDKYARDDNKNQSQGGMNNPRTRALTNRKGGCGCSKPPSSGRPGGSKRKTTEGS